MLGGKRARDARIHTGGSSYSNYNNKPKSSWTKYEWMQEVADYINLNSWDFKCDYYARANVDSINIEASLKFPVSHVIIMSEAKNLAQKAANATGCPFKFNIDVDIYD